MIIDCGIMLENFVALENEGMLQNEIIKWDWQMKEIILQSPFDTRITHHSGLIRLRNNL